MANATNTKSWIRDLGPVAFEFLWNRFYGAHPLVGAMATITASIKKSYQGPAQLIKDGQTAHFDGPTPLSLGEGRFADQSLVARSPTEINNKSGPRAHKFEERGPKDDYEVLEYSTGLRKVPVYVVTFEDKDPLFLSRESMIVLAKQGAPMALIKEITGTRGEINIYDGVIPLATRVRMGVMETPRGLTQERETPYLPLIMYQITD